MKTCPIHVIPDKSSNELDEDFLSLLRTLHLHISLQLHRGFRFPIRIVYILHSDVGSVETVWLAAFFLTTSLAVCTATYFPPHNTQWTIANC